MLNISLQKLNPVVRYFSRLVEWLGLSRNSGSILAFLYLAKYETGERFSLDEIAKATHFSRSNVAFFLSQLEAMGLISGETDLNQTGRGRRRILYALAEEISSPVSILIKQMIDKLVYNLQEIKSLRASLGSEMTSLKHMFADFEEETTEALESLK